MFAQEPNIIAFYMMYVLYKLQADNIHVLNPLKLNNEEISKYLGEKNTDLRLHVSALVKQASNVGI